MIHGVVFDMDGLMFDTERLAMESWIHAGKKLGAKITEALVLQTIGVDWEKTKDIFIGHFGPGFDYRKVREAWQRYVSESIARNGVPVKTGLLELLSYLYGHGYPMTVATSTERARAEACLENAGVRKYFGRIVCGDMIENGKPAPDIYRKAAEVIHTPPEECIALEDSPAGILSAHRAGMKPVMIPDLMQPDEPTAALLYAKLASLCEVVDLLEKDRNKN